MAQPSTRSNVHPVDRLAEVRAQIKFLEEMQDDLRAEIIRTGQTIGDHMVASIQQQKRSVLDRAKLEAKFGKQAVAACCDVRDMTLVKLTPRK